MPIRIAKGRAHGGVTGAVAADERDLRGERGLRQGVDLRDLRDLRGERMGFDERDERGLRDWGASFDASDLGDLRGERAQAPQASLDSLVISQAARAPLDPQVTRSFAPPLASLAPLVSPVI